MTKIHCIHLYEWTTEKYLRFSDESGAAIHKNWAGGLDAAVERMNKADKLFFHNGHFFDYQALKKFRKDFKPNVKALMDTITMAKAVFRNIRGTDFGLMAKGRLPENFAKMQLVGKHSLKAWGVRLGVLKSTIADEDGTTDWSVWTPEMDDYCEQDVRVTVALLKKILTPANLTLHPMECHELDNHFQHLMSRQELQGFYFDEKRAEELHSSLEEKRMLLEKELREFFPPFYKKGKYFVPKRDNKTQGYIADCGLTKVALTEFNPASRDHIQLRLQALYGWKPTNYGADGKATVDESTLKGLPYPPVAKLLEYLKVDKILGQLASGKQNWLKHVKNGRLRGRIDPMGTVTWRCSHSHPNLGQVPAVDCDGEGHPIFGIEGGYGADCRSLFTVPPGSTLCGHDGSGLELRCLGHYMAKYDGGDYADVVVNGDVHTLNQKAIGLNKRNNAKTWIYAFLYGAGNFKLGTIVLADMEKDRQRAFYEKFGNAGVKYERRVTKLGADSRASMENSLPALKKLIAKIQQKAKQQKSLRALDGRLLEVRSAHSALNTVLQSCGAIIMKRWLVILDERLQEEAGMVPKQWSHKDDEEGDYEYVANVHDEAQTEVSDERAEQYDDIAVSSFPMAGDYYGFRTPIEGEGKLGQTWTQTH